jgi:hypothetical protein
MMRKLKDLILRGEFPHAFLLSGGHGTQRLLFAKALTVELFAADASTQDKIEREIYEDLLILHPERNEIRVDEIEKITQMLRNKPFSADRMVVIIEDADKMNAFSQNKLLKTLEEPSKGNTLFLLCAKPEKLYATIRSRCAQYRLPYTLSVTDERVYTAAKSIISSTLFGRTPFHELFRCVDPYCTKDSTADAEETSANASDLLDAMEEFVRDLTVGARAHALLLRPEHLSIVEKMNGRGDGTLRKYIKLLENTRNHIERGFNSRSGMHSMLIQMRREAINDSSSRG